MRCEDVREEFLAWVDEELSSGQQAAVEDHLSGCPSCRKELAGLQRTLGLLQSLPTCQPSEGFARSFWQRLAREPRRAPFWIGSFGWGKAIALAAGLVLCVVLSGLLWLRAPGEQWMSREDREIATRLELFQDFDAIAQLDLLEDMDVIEALPDLK